jgi:hypothetical protein
VFFTPILHGSRHVLIHLFVKSLLSFLLVVGFVLDIFIFDFDDILFIVIDDAEEFPFDFEVVLVDFVLVEEVHLLLEDEV